MRIDDIRSIVKEHGRKAFVQVLGEALVGANGVKKLAPEKVSIRALWEGLVGPVHATLGPSRVVDGLNFMEIQEQIDSTAFPSATGVLIAAKVIEAYENVPRIGDMLVTPMPSRLKSERIVGFTALEGAQEVPEAMPYQDSSFTEKYVTTETAKKGRLLSITEEAIYFDQTGQIMMRAGRIGEATAQEREKTILSGIVDVGSAAAGYKDVYRPSGTAGTLYLAGNTNLLATATPLVDWTDIDETLQYHATNVRDDRAIAAEREPILWMPNTLLVARRLLGTASRILSATEHRSQPGATDASNVLISGNPLQSVLPGLRVLSSPLIDFFSTVTGSRYDDARDWFLGDFAKDFIWQEIWPLQTFRAPAMNEDQFNRDVIARFKVRYYGGVAAIDTKHVVKVNAV